MTHINRGLIAALAFSAIFSSCKKNDSGISDPGVPDKTQLNALFADLRSTPQTFTVTAGSNSKIYGAEGTLIYFYANSFKDKNGNIITSGTVNIQLTEMYKMGDMIANRATTATSDGLLTSGGQVNLKASIHGTEVFANSYSMGFKQPASSTKPMELYYGNTNNTDSSTTWTAGDTSKQGGAAGRTTYITDTSYHLIEQPYYIFSECTSFDWINCDHPYNTSSGKAKVTFVFADKKFTGNNTEIWVCFPSLNVVANFGCSSTYYSATNRMVFNGYTPLATDCKFVVVTKIGSDYYYSSQTGQVTDNMTVNVAMAPATMTTVKAFLKSL